MPTTLSAAEALDRLKEGNKRFLDEVTSYTLPTNGHERRIDLKENGQHPFAIILSCADSRVVPEDGFDEGLGDLFVIRVAGNSGNTSSVASIEYAVAHLGTKLIVVLGHENCGAVGAAIEAAKTGESPGSPSLDKLVTYIDPAINACGGPDAPVNTVVQKHAAMTTDVLIEKSEIIRNAVDNGGLKIVSAYYHLGSGEVSFVED